jgi:ATP-dependent DNA helicase RecQ
LNYFGDVEETTLGPCGHCDLCSSPPVVTEADEELLQQARMVLATVDRFQGRFGATRITDVLYGSTGKAVLELRLHTTESFGRLRAIGRTGITRLIRRLAASGHIIFDGLEFPVVTLSAKGTAVLKGTVSLVWEQADTDSPKDERKVSTEKPSRSAPLHDGHPDRDLFERLRALRAKMASEEGVAPFMVFHDKTLRNIASMRPSSISTLESVPGIGPAKLERYGRQVLQVVNEEGGT